MLTHAVESYLAVRRATGFNLKYEGRLLQSFATFSDALGKDYVSSEAAVQWAGLTRSPSQRARRLGQVIRFAQYMRAEDPRHELPSAVFGSEKRPRPVPYIFSKDDIHRLVPLHETAHAGLERYLQRRRSFAPFDDHVFVSLRRRPLLLRDTEAAFHAAIGKIGTLRGPGLTRPTIHSLRHTFTVRALETCPDGRDRITKHMLALSTYLGHSRVADTYWYLEATPQLLQDIVAACEIFMKGETQ